MLNFNFMICFYIFVLEHKSKRTMNINLTSFTTYYYYCTNNRTNVFMYNRRNNDLYHLILYRHSQYCSFSLLYTLSISTYLLKNSNLMSLFIWLTLSIALPNCKNMYRSNSFYLNLCLKHS
jgi:hypothetical protein